MDVDYYSVVIVGVEGVVELEEVIEQIDGVGKNKNERKNE